MQCRVGHSCVWARTVRMLAGQQREGLDGRMPGGSENAPDPRSARRGDTVSEREIQNETEDTEGNRFHGAVTDGVDDTEGNGRVKNI